MAHRGRLVSITCVDQLVNLSDFNKLAMSWFDVKRHFWSTIWSTLNDLGFSLGAPSVFRCGIGRFWQTTTPTGGEWLKAGLYDWPDRFFGISVLPHFSIHGHNLGNPGVTLCVSRESFKESYSDALLVMRLCLWALERALCDPLFGFSGLCGKPCSDTAVA